MARIRSIKPEFPQSESIGKLTRESRLLFLQLFTLVDDEGRTRAASRMLASLLYPYDDDARTLIDGWLGELSENRMITVYEIDGSTYLEINNWLKHQKIDHPTKSKIPSPDSDFAKIRENSRSLAPDLDRIGRDRSSTDASHLLSETSSDEQPKPKKSRLAYPEDFEAFWKAYPTDALMSKKAALSQWRKLDEGDKSKATASVPAFIAYCRANATYRPVHACRYISDRRFDGFSQTVERVALIASVVVTQESPQGRAWEDYTRATKGKGVPWTNGAWRFPTEFPPVPKAAE